VPAERYEQPGGDEQAGHDDDRPGEPDYEEEPPPSKRETEEGADMEDEGSQPLERRRDGVMVPPPAPDSSY
jgi:hypothetical protein